MGDFALSLTLGAEGISGVGPTIMGRIISGKYEELEQLGQGSQGVVYKVRHIGHKTDLALKVLPPYLLEDEELVARFEQEAQMMTRLRHRNIARVLGSGCDETLKLHFIVLEYIQGKNLKQLLREKGPLPLSEVLEIARQIAGALDYAHNQPSPIIHRDIKPTNIMLEDLSGRVVVLDFGIAKELGALERSNTRTGVMLGTWKYCAPEQLRHEPLSGNADVYSLGMVMYEMYTGTPFFSGLDERAVLGKVLHDQREHDPYFARQTLPAFVTLVTKAIAKSRDKRYRRMADFLNDLEACWWALDDTRTMILSPQSLNARPPDAPIGDMAELDKQIHRLEEERQRHTVTAIQGQLRIAKEQAERGGARQWASALFEQGLAHEREGDTQSRERRYLQAQESYDAAIVLFTQASKEASTSATAQQMEKERQTAYTAKVDAERAGAHEQTNEIYTQALTTLRQADQLWEQQHVLKAEPLYRDARHLFEDARDFAYNDRQRGEAEAVREQAQKIRVAAFADGLAAFAATILEEGQVYEHQGATALAQEDFPQASRFYLAALQKYEHALRQAQRAQQRRQEVLALAAQTQTLQQQALAAGQSVQHQASYSQAEELVRQATTLLDAHEYTKAGHIYTQARDCYEAALRAVEGELQQKRVQTARDAAVAARQRAEEAEADRWFPAAWDDGQKAEEAAHTLAAREQWDDALRHYQQIQEKWESLFVAARQCQVQAQAEQAQHALLREAAERARTSMQVAQKAALLVNADTLAGGLIQEAKTAEQQADIALTNGEFVPARQCYETAQQQYARAEAQARMEQQRQMQRAVVAAREVQVAHDRVRALGLDLETVPTYQEARTTHQHATTLFEANQHAQAEAAYRQARKHYEQAAREVEHRQITTAQDHMHAAQEAATQVGAVQFCAEEWTETIQSATIAQQHVDRGETAQALAVFQQTEERFTQLRTLALQRKAQIEEQQRQRAFAAQRTAEEGRTTAENAEAPQYAAALYGQAMQLMDDAQQHLQGARWHNALPLLTQARELFAKASKDAARENARQTAHAAREKAVTNQQETQSGRGPVYFPERFAQAATLLRNAEAALRRGDFSLAQRGFEEGAVLLQRIRHTAAVREKVEEELAALPVSELGTPGEEIPSLSPVVSPMSVQPDQRKEPRPPTSDRPQNGTTPERLPQKAPSAISLLHRASETPHSTFPPQTIPPTALLSGKSIGIVAALVLLVIGGYLLRSRPADTSKVMATAPVAPSTLASKTLPHDEQKPILPPSPLTSREDIESAPVPRGQAEPTPPISPSAQPIETADQQAAKATSPLPPEPRLLTIQDAEPGPGEEFSLREGETLPFSVTVGDGGNRSLRYRWTLNGVQRSTNATWRYKPKFDEAEEASKAVHVVVRDDAGQMVEREWRVRVLNVNRSPTITAATPRLGTTVDVAAGATQPFSVHATDPDKEGPLTYRWLLDGDEVGTVQTGNWQLRAPSSDGTHQLTVEIQDAAGQKIQQSWDVVVNTRTPSLRWVRFQPKDERLRTHMGQPVQFSALAELSPSARGVEKLQYQWRVNESVLETEDTGRFQFAGDRAGRYQVSVVALNAEGIRSPLRKWEIEVRTLEPPPSVKSSEEIVPDPRSVERCTNDVSGWVENYRRAWETKNVRTLASLGVISQLDRDRVTENLKQYQVFRVTLTAMEVQCESDQATVSFKRVDTIDGTTFVHPERTIFHLEKKNGRWMIRSR